MPLYTLKISFDTENPSVTSTTVNIDVVPPKHLTKDVVEQTTKQLTTLLRTLGPPSLADHAKASTRVALLSPGAFEVEKTKALSDAARSVLIVTVSDAAVSDALIDCLKKHKIHVYVLDCQVEGFNSDLFKSADVIYLDPSSYFKLDDLTSVLEAVDDRIYPSMKLIDQYLYGPPEIGEMVLPPVLQAAKGKGELVVVVVGSKILRVDVALDREPDLPRVSASVGNNHWSTRHAPCGSL